MQILVLVKKNNEFGKVNFVPAVDTHLTLEICVDNAINELSLVRNIQDNDFNNHTLTNINIITLKTPRVNDIQVARKNMLMMN